MNEHTGDVHHRGELAVPAGRPGMASAAAAHPVNPYRAAQRTGWRWGLAAGAALAALYAVTLSLLNGAAYAWETFLALWYWMTPLVAGFALQVGLFGYSRAVARAGVSPHASGVVASGGASALSMVACCAHHLADVLPLVGMAGLALILSTYQGLFLLAGLLSNAVGTVYLLSEMQKHRLYNPNGALLAPLLRWPLRPAVPYVAGVSVLILAVAIYWEVWA